MKERQQKLTDYEKRLGTFSNCQGCIKKEKYLILLNEFPGNKHARVHSKEKAPTK